MGGFVFVSTMSSYPWGGSEELWSRAALRLKQKGHRVAASVAGWPQLAPQVLELAKSQVELSVRSPIPRTLLEKLAQRLRQDTKRSCAWIKAERPDLVVISEGCAFGSLEWMQYCHANDLPFVTVVQANSDAWWPTDELAAEMREAYGAARKIFCVSRANLKLLERQLGTGLRQAEIIWNPWNVQEEDVPVWPQENVFWRVGCVARMDPAAKGQDIILEVLTRAAWRQRPIQLNLYGTGPCEQSLRRLGNQLGLRNVHFHGHVTDIAKVWATNHLLVLPSRYEGTPLALVEAMWCKRAAVVTDVGGNAELCADGETGFVVAAPAVALVEQALERAWSQRSDWQNMGEKARARIEKIVPKDPPGYFCEQLLECVNGLIYP